MMDVVDNLSIIVAMARNQGIGEANQLPWHLPNDLRHFKSITMGKPVIMGSKTYESIGKPLPGRLNIVLSRRNQERSGCVCVSSLEEALECSEDADERFVIGGGQIYALALPKVKRLYITEVETELATADRFFPPWDRTAFRELAREDHRPDSKHPFGYRFLTFERC